MESAENTGAQGAADVQGVAETNNAKALEGAGTEHGQSQKPEEQLATDQAKMEEERKAMEAKHLAEEAAKAKAAEEEAARAAERSMEEPAPMLRMDGPTLEEFVAEGYDPAQYPPRGYAAVTADERARANPNAPTSRLHQLEKRVAALEAKLKHF